MYTVSLWCNCHDCIFGFDTLTIELGDDYSMLSHPVYVTHWWLLSIACMGYVAGMMCWVKCVLLWACGVCSMYCTAMCSTIWVGGYYVLVHGWSCQGQGMVSTWEYDTGFGDYLEIFIEKTLFSIYHTLTTTSRIYRSILTGTWIQCIDHCVGTVTYHMIWNGCGRMCY